MRKLQQKCNDIHHQLRELTTSLQQALLANATLQQQVQETKLAEATLQEQLEGTKLAKATLQNQHEEAQQANSIFQKQIEHLQDQSHWIVKKEEIEITKEVIGKGSWGEVKVAKFRGLRVAAKCLHELIMSPYNISVFTREMEIAA